MQELAQSSIENGTDVIILAEAENLDTPYLIRQLARVDKKFEKKALVPQNKGIMLLANIEIKVSVYKEEKHYSAYKIHDKNHNYLLIALHLTSAMFKDESARAQRAGILNNIINKLEESCNDEAFKANENSYHTIIVGDFNLQPFSNGIIGAYGFNAVMDAQKAEKISRTLDGQQVKFYYNPIWHLMGNQNGVPGTYYTDTDQEDKSFYWYTFDQVLLRPALIKYFVWDEFVIIDHVGTKSLVQSGKIHKEKYSDHLPIKFEIK